MVKMSEKEQQMKYFKRHKVIQNNEEGLIIEHSYSAIKKIKQKSGHFLPRNVVSNIQKQTGGMFEMSSRFKVARDSMQIYNAARDVDKQNNKKPGNQRLTTLRN